MENSDQHVNKRANELYKMGVELQQNATTKEQHQSAIETFTCALTLRSNYSLFYFARGNSYYAFHDFQNACKDFSSAIELNGNNPMYYSNRGECYKKMGLTSEALRDLSQAIDMDPSNVGTEIKHITDQPDLFPKGPYYFHRGTVLNKAGFIEEAIVDFTKAIDGNNSGTRQIFRSYLNRGNCYRSLGQFDESIKDLTTAIGMDPQYALAYNNLGLAYLESGSLDKAIGNFTNAIQLYDRKAIYYNNRGLAYYQKGEDFFLAGLLDCHKAIEFDGNEASYYYNRGNLRLAVVQLQLQQVEKPMYLQEHHVVQNTPMSTTPPLPTIQSSIQANETIVPSYESQEVVVVDEEDEDLRNGKISIKRQLEVALADLVEARRLDRANVLYIHTMGLIFQQMDRHSDACATFLEALQCDPQHTPSKFHLGLSYHILKEYNQAINCYSSVSKVFKTNPMVFEAKALVYQDMNAHELAIQDFSIAFSFQQLNVDGLYHRGESYLKLRNYTKALDDLNEAIVLDCSCPSLFQARALAYRGTGNHLLAINDLSNALSLEPSSSTYYYNRAVIYLEMQKYDQAENDFLVSLQLANNPQTQFCLGVTYYNQNKCQDAIVHLLQSLQSSPPSHYIQEIYYYLGLSHCVLLEYDNAIEFYTKAIQENANQDKILQYVKERAKAYHLNHKFIEAIQDYNRIIQANPKNPYAYFRRGYAYKALGNVNAAAEDFETVKHLDPHNPELKINYKMLDQEACIALCRQGKET